MILWIRIIAICIISVLLTAVVKILPRHRIPQWVYLAALIVGIFLWVIAYAWEWWCVPDMVVIYALTMSLTTIRRFLMFLSYPGMLKVYLSYMADNLVGAAPFCLVFLFTGEFWKILFPIAVGYQILIYTYFFSMYRSEGNPYESTADESPAMKWTLFFMGLFVLACIFLVQYGPVIGSAINRWISQYFMVTP